MLVKILHLLVFLLEKRVTVTIESTQNTMSIPVTLYLLGTFSEAGYLKFLNQKAAVTTKPRNGIQRVNGSPRGEGTLLVTIT